MDYFEFFGGSLALLLAIRQFLRKKSRAGRLVAVLYLCLSWSQYRSFFEGSIRVGNHEHPIPQLTIIVIAGITAHFYFNCISRPDCRPKPYHSLRYLYAAPALLTDILILSTGYVYSDHSVFGHVITAAHWVGGVFLIAILCIDIAVLFSVFSFKDMGFAPRFIFFVSLYLIGAVSCGLINIVTGKEALDFLSTLLFTILLIFLFIATDKHPELMSQFSMEVEKAKYARSLLGDIDKVKLKKQLTLLMEVEQVYKFEKCTLGFLSRKVGLTAHQLSEFLNNNLGTSFPIYVNSYRIRKSQELLAGNDQKTILEIAFEVGFGNKTSFNETFLRVTGTTPTEYRKQVLENSQKNDRIHKS